MSKPASFSQMIKSWQGFFFLASNPGMENIQATQASMPGQCRQCCGHPEGGTSEDPLKRKVASKKALCFTSEVRLDRYSYNSINIKQQNTLTERCWALNELVCVCMAICPLVKECYFRQLFYCTNPAVTTLLQTVLNNVL